jgi:hypothetical protein
VFFEVDEALKGDLEHKGKRYGLVLDIGGYYKNVITLAPALTITHDEIDLGLALLDQLAAVFWRVSRNGVAAREHWGNTQFVLLAGGSEANSRFRTPIMPALAILAAAGILRKP